MNFKDKLISTLLEAKKKNPKLMPGWSTGARRRGGLIRKLKSGEQGTEAESSGLRGTGRTASGELDHATGEAMGSVGNRDPLMVRLKAFKAKKRKGVPLKAQANYSGMVRMRDRMGL